MRVFVLSLWLLIATFANTAGAEKLVLGMSQDEVAITATFDGSSILIFGAVKRDVDPSEGPLDVIVTIGGPNTPITVRRKERKYGIWVNTDQVTVDSAPSYYAVATNRPLKDVLSNHDDFTHKISIERAIGSVATKLWTPDYQNFANALVRIRAEKGLYQLLENSVALDQETLFHTTIPMPADLTEGDYPTRIFLTRDGQVIDQIETSIDVRKVGLERFLYRLSRDTPLIYGLLSLAIAIFAGWFASAIFRVVRLR